MKQWPERLVFFALINLIRYFSILGTHCSNPPLPPDEKNLKTIDWDGNPILIGESITFNCVDNMKTEDAFIDASVTITCGADNAFSPSDPDWPQCVPSKSHCLSRYLNGKKLSHF